jgi:hypothetical protein
MAYQNINQYNFRRFGLKPVNEITDLCLASDEKDYDQEVIFSPLLIGEDDGNRMPFKFDFNSSGTTLCQDSSCVFSSDTIVSENYWNPTDTDPNFCPIVTNLCDVGLTGIDNGLVQNMSGETIQVTTGLYTNISDKFSRYKYDRRMKLHPITGFTTTQNRLWNDGSYNYNLSYTNEGGDIGYVATLNGGFYQGFYKLAGYDYQVFPQRVSLGWTTEFLLKYRWTGNTSVGLNVRYPDNKGTFFYMGARAENKFYHYADGSPKQDSGYTRVTSGLTCMHTCGCASTANTSSDCLQVYQPSGGTITTCLCGCPCECSTNAKYPEKDPLYDEVSNALSLRLSGDTGSPRLCVKTYRITGGCESTGTCLTGLTYVTGTSVTEWCSTRGIFDDCSGTTYANIEHWVQIDTVFERYEWFDTCDLYDKGGLGLLVKDVYFATLEGRSVSLIEPPITREQPYDPASTEVVTFNDMWTEEQKYRLGTLKFYVNGKLFMVAENFEEIIPRLLNVEKEKQIGVGYNISIGGGTQGLHDNLTFSGGCPESLNDLKYQQDPECLTTYDLDNTIYSGLTTQIKLEEYFGGSMIGDISAFRMYIEPLNAAQIKHNFKILKEKYDLLNPDCPNCRIPVASPTPTQTPTITPTKSVTPTQTPTITPTKSVTPTPTITPTTTQTPTNTPTNTETPTPTPTNTITPTITVTPTPTPATLPTVTTDEYGSLFNGGAQITGTIVSNGGSTITERGIVWSTSPNPTITNNTVSDGSGNPDALGQFVHTYTMLPNPHGTPVYVRIYATNAIGTSYGAQVSFTMPCFIKGTKITLASGLRKNIEDISYDDSLLVWNFDEGRFDSANPIWIMTPVLTQYVNILFSDGSNLGISGHLNHDGGHRIFNLDKGEFTYAIPNEHSPIGTRTFNDKGDIVTIVGKEESTEVEEIYNIVTNRHLNIFAEGILTSRRLNNLYPIEDMKFIKDERSITSIEEFKGVPVEYYEGLRLGEQPLATNSEGFLVKTPGELAYTLPTVSELEQWTVEFIKKKS